jgi:hypothetical protein
VPQSYVDKGDPYQQQCIETTEALRAALGPLGAKLKLTFQSRFGRAEWIKPYTDKTVEALAREGVKRIVIVTPGFAADCLETIEEIGEENKEIFLEYGGERFSYIPLNDSHGGIPVLVHLIERELQGWITCSPASRAMGRGGRGRCSGFGLMLADATPMTMREVNAVKPNCEDRQADRGAGRGEGRERPEASRRHPIRGAGARRDQYRRRHLWQKCRHRHGRVDRCHRPETCRAQARQEEVLKRCVRPLLQRSA